MVSSSIIFKINNSYFITLNIFIHLTIIFNFQFYIHASVAVSKHKILHNFVLLLHQLAGAVRCSATWLMLIFLTQNRISWNNVHLLSRTSYILHPTPAHNHSHPCYSNDRRGKLKLKLSSRGWKIMWSKLIHESQEQRIMKTYETKL